MACYIEGILPVCFVWLVTLKAYCQCVLNGLFTLKAYCQCVFNGLFTLRDIASVFSMACLH